MARTHNSRFETVMPMLKKENVGAINWGFVSGKTNTIYSWETPMPDGSEPKELRQTMECELQYMEERGEYSAKVYEAAGGYAPTIGIIGAVLGLIQVMKNLANIEEVGHGIAVAFVATVYGVGLANIVLLPAASKIKSRIERETELKELKLEGVIGIVEGLNPKLIRSKLDAYRHDAPAKAKESKDKKPAGAPQPAAAAKG